MSDWIHNLNQLLLKSGSPVVTVESQIGEASVRDIKHSLAEAITREVISPSTGVVFRDLFIQLQIYPAELLLITPGITIFDKPYKATRCNYFINNQDLFWLPGGDIGIYDETVSWVIRTGDDGQTFLSLPINR